MKLSENWEDFERNFQKAFGMAYQPRLPLIIEVKAEESVQK
jgi:hypothetical protein